MSTLSSITTAELLFAAGDLGRCELIRGELITMTPAGDRHGSFGMDLVAELSYFIKHNGLGRSYLAETGFVLARNPDTVRAPDFAFISHATLSRQKTPVRGYREGAPDLVVEVLSPDDTASDVAAKVLDWLIAGTQIVLVVDPRLKSITMHLPDHTAKMLTMADELRLEPVIPGFAMQVKEVFTSTPGA